MRAHLSLFENLQLPMFHKSMWHSGTISVVARWRLFKEPFDRKCHRKKPHLKLGHSCWELWEHISNYGQPWP